jgi:hypothetical protein
MARARYGASTGSCDEVFAKSADLRTSAVSIGQTGTEGTFPA